MAARARRCWHALIRQNFGCPFDAHHIFDQLWPGPLICKPLKIDITCRKCCGMARAKTCPHGPKEHISISGTQQREMFLSNAESPPECSRPEVVAILKEYYASLRWSGEQTTS
jgi:sulfate adenylyltransferase